VVRQGRLGHVGGSLGCHRDAWEFLFAEKSIKNSGYKL
jgi:hypothetical protein